MPRSNALPKSSTERADELFRQALQLHQQAHLEQAGRIYEQILREMPDHSDALHLLGVISYQTQDYRRASDLIGQAIAISPSNAAYYSNMGLVLHWSGNFDGAIASYDKAIALMPAYAEAWFNRGNSLQKLDRLDEAVVSYDQAISLRPTYAEAWSNRGFVLRRLLKSDAAIASCDRAIAINPVYADAWANRGNALIGLERYDEAIASYDKAISFRPEYTEVWINRGNALQELKAFEAAIASYDRSIALDPSNAEAWLNRGNALKALNRPEAAIGSYDKAISLRPGYVEAWFNQANVLLGLRQWDAAVDRYDKVISLKPEYAEAHSDRGIALYELKQPEAAIVSYERAISLKPGHAEAYANRGVVLSDIKEFDAALACYEKALSIKPDGDYWSGEYLHLKMMICDWAGFDQLLTRVVTKIGNHERASTPFPVLSMTSSLSATKQAALSYVEDRYPKQLKSLDIPKSSGHGRIRIGYCSADFHDHATMYLMAELFEKHDRSKFETFAFSFGPDRKEDSMRKRGVAAFDHFIDVRAMSDKEVALMSRELEIDIAVDLKGFTENARTGIFSYRAAPIQVNYLGYPGTMGAEYMDYLIADHTLVPQHSRQFYTEKLVYLPYTYQVNDANRQVADRGFTREELGLPTTGFVFCCFNNNYKITPETFDCWMRILQRVEGSVLWLLEDNPQALGNLRREAAKRGVDAVRLVFARRMPLAEHLARHRSADLFLDTLPYNAHTTASDALWTGLPVLTLAGESFAGRVAASLLNAIELPELVTFTRQGYEAMAIELATDPEKLAVISRKLEKNRLSAALFDSSLFTRHIEAAYELMYQRYHLDLPPDHIDVKP
ncbi:MAG: tetratricopeptide repeat protein [Chlorobiaceae bacterium]|nr:tetratricopeptide repeat protein [Chlorobiaceae bacterium]